MVRTSIVHLTVGKDFSMIFPSSINGKVLYKEKYLFILKYWTIRDDTLWHLLSVEDDLLVDDMQLVCVCARAHARACSEREMKRD